MVLMLPPDQLSGRWERFDYFMLRIWYEGSE
jgi:hypothetical protein